MTWTISRRLSAIVAAGAVLALVLSGAAWRSFAKIDVATASMERSAQILRSHMDADMMHDAIRADVLAEFAATEMQAQSEILAEYEEHAKRLRASVSTSRGLARDPAVVEALAGVAGPLDAYLESASNALSIAAREGARARARVMPGFLASFRDLEDPMSEVSDLIEQHAATSRAEASAAMAGARRLMLVLTVVGGLLLGAAGFSLRRAILGPIHEVIVAVQALAAGDLTVRLDASSRDETGTMSEALNTAIERMQDSVLAIADTSTTLASAAEELSAVSTQIGGNARETSVQAGDVAESADRVSKNIQTVAAGSQEMSVSIREIASNAAHAAQVAKGAVDAAESTNRTVIRLGESSRQINDVIRLITSIAEQTNLLALNATIEAARAGEAGKGFAVVANEVKELAKETARATDDVAKRVDAIQGDTQEAVDAIGSIGGVIQQLSDISVTIAAAVEQQAATTEEIGRNVEDATRGATAIAGSIGGVATAAESTSEGVQHARNSSQELTTVAATLERLVRRFNVGAARGSASHEARPLDATQGEHQRAVLQPEPAAVREHRRVA